MVSSRAEFLQRHDQQVDRPRADGAAAGQRHLGLMHPRQQRRDHPEAGAHPRHQFVGRGGIDDVGRRNMQGLALIFMIAGPLARRHDIDAVIAENALQLGDVGEPRHVVEDQRLLGQKPRDHQRQRGILRARDRDGAIELAAADDANAIHGDPRFAMHKVYKAGAGLRQNLRLFQETRAGKARIPKRWTTCAPCVRPSQGSDEIA